MSIHASSSPPHPSSIPLPLDEDWGTRQTCQLSSWCSNFCPLPPILKRGDPCTQERPAETMVWAQPLRWGHQEALPLTLSGHSLGTTPPPQGGPQAAWGVVPVSGTGSSGQELAQLLHHTSGLLGRRSRSPSQAFWWLWLSQDHFWQLQERVGAQSTKPSHCWVQNHGNHIKWSMAVVL